jgi:hypothetical protein
LYCVDIRFGELGSGTSEAQLGCRQQSLKSGIRPDGREIRVDLDMFKPMQRHCGEYRLEQIDYRIGVVEIQA